MHANDNDIAVIGIGCRFPEASNAEAFYRNLLANRDSVGEIPKDRWDYSELFTSRLDDRDNRITSKWGGFISGVDEFDPRFFKILPSEAELLDPQQKLFLTCSWEALEDAGYARRAATAGRQIGVYAGVTWNEFSLYANEYGYLRGQYKGAGSLYWGIPNRVSYFFDFLGPSIAIDTACSSSLVALHLAAQSLRSGECEMALAGGVNLNLHPAKYLFLSSASFLSTEGKCRGFGEGGSGYVPSEGVAVVVLKRLRAAVEAGDRIYGVVRGTATNHGGKATGYTVPNPRAHKEVIRRALDRARVNARDVSYVECHGTGTDLGDPIEIAGLRMAFEEHTKDRQFCGVGTVKSNIGHCEAAAGLAGLIKVLFSMRAGVLPATLHAAVPNRKIDFENGPFYLVRENTRWEPRDGVLLAGLSSFGAGGSNSHCVIQSWPAKRTAAGRRPAGLRLVPVSALNAERTRAYCETLRRHLAEHAPALDDVACTLGRRETFEHRVAFLADSTNALIEALDRYLASPAEQAGVVAAPGVDGAYAEAERLRALGAQWIAGAALLSDVVPSEGELIDLPTYAFEKSRSWIHGTHTLYQRDAETLAALHPLVDCNVSTAARGAWTKRLHRREFFVDEHFVQDQPVLPGVCLVEMATFAARSYLESEEVGLSDVWFLEPVALREADSVDLRVEIAAAEGETRFEVLSRSRSVKHATGRVRAARAAAPAPVDLAGIAAECPESMAPEALYERFARSGIVQKGRFKVVREFRYGPNRAMARLRLADELLGETRYVMNPTLLDGAVQAAMVHLFTRLPQTETVLPFQIGSCVRHRALPATVVAVATLKNLDARKYDVVVCDESGTVLAELSDFVLRDYKAKPRELRASAFTPVLVQAPAPSETPAHRSEATLLLADMNGPSVEPHVPSAWSYLDLRAASEGERQLAEWLAQLPPERMARVVFLTDAAGGAEGDVATVLAVARRLYDLAQAVARSGRPADVVCCLAGKGEMREMLAQACLGFAKSLNLELPQNRFRVVTFESWNDAGDLLQRVVRECAAPAAAVYTAYQGDARLVEKLAAVDLPEHADAGDGAPPAWIVTGGGGRLGLLVARHLLAQGRRVVLLGRSPLGDAGRQMLQAFPSESWKYLRADLTNGAKAAEAVRGAIDRFGHVWGVVHCAGVLEDGAFLSKPWSTFERVVTAKVASLLNVCRGLAAQDVRRVVLFSSLTSLFGNRGQSDYAFANGCLDGFAHLAARLFARPPLVTAFHWPYWEEGGMKVAADKLAGYVEHFATQPLPTGAGLALFDRLPATNAARVGVIYSDARLEEIEKRLALKPLAGTEERAVRRAPAPAAAPVSEEERREAIRKYLLHFFEQQLKLTLTESDFDLPFAELGVDSIAQMDLIGKLEKEKRFDSVSQALLVEHTTMRALTEYFYNRHPHADYSLG